MKSIQTAMLTAALVGVGVASACGAQEAEPRVRADRNVIVVTGMGEANAAPDLAYVTLGVATTGRRAQEAAQANAAASQKVITALRGQGIAQRDIQTSGYNIQPQYEQRPGRDPAIVGYQVNNTVRATVRALDKVGAVVDAALEAGANTVQGVSFGLDARGPVESEALARAVRAARTKAETLARAADVRLGAVLRIDEGVGYRPMPMMEANMAFSRAGGAATPIEPGELTVTAHVTVTFALPLGDAPRGR